MRFANPCTFPRRNPKAFCKFRHKKSERRGRKREKMQGNIEKANGSQMKRAESTAPFAAGGAPKRPSILAGAGQGGVDKPAAGGIPQQGPRVAFRAQGCSRLFKPCKGHLPPPRNGRVHRDPAYRY